MGLEAYREKRRFERTREPRGRTARKRGLSFVVQEHDATRLHFDFRLELDGVLLSWAVPKGPSLDPHDKRLAIEVEDHPVEYGGFEGTIPEGEYGAGTVMVWDRGTWEPEGDPREAYERGSLKFTLHGEKLKGRWHLVRTGSDDRGRKRWLLFKGSDDEARRGEPVIESAPASALTGRTLDEIAAEEDRPASAAKFRPPELTTLVKEPPAGDAWLHEIKLDGYRILAHLSRGKVTLFSRNGKDWTERMPSVASALARLEAKSAVIDGEVVALREDGVSDFQRLQNALGRSDDELTYFVFDLLERDGRDLRREPLEARKAALLRLVPKDGASARVRFNDHVVGNGEGFFANACKLGLEGIVSKRRDAPYREGRGRDWLKVKCLGRQEFVIVGWTDPRRSRAHFGALLLATRAKGRELVYVGKVGTGFSEASLASIAPKLRALARETSPLARPPRERGLHWVEPRVVCEVDYKEMTDDGILRQPSFRGLRQDKAAEEIVLERSPSRRRARARVSNEDKVFYPESGITKGQVAAYLERVSAWMLPHVAGRPLMLLRCPDGIGKCFIQKHTTPVLPAGVRAIDVGEEEKHVTVDDAAGLLALAQAGVLEIHTWGAHADAPDNPDLLVFDLDPDASVAFGDVVAAARLLRERLESLRLESFVKTTGGKGLHVACAIAPTMTWDAAKSFARAVAQAVTKEDPAHLVATMSKERRKGKIFVDYLRNGRGATFIAPYSPRARPFAPIAMPLSWDELSDDLRPDQFTIANASERLDALRADPWAKLGKRPRRR